MKNKNICIIGGTGSVARILLPILDKHNVTIFSRGEYEQHKLRKLYPDHRYRIGDIRDRQALAYALKGIDIVYHFAAQKHVSSCEQNAMEAVKTNIEGTNNVIDACVDNDVKVVVYMSTDKSVRPINAYGCTKLIAEKMIMRQNKLNYIIVRSGNLIKSRGSVIPMFLEAKRSGQVLELTDERMERYFVKDAVLQKIFKLALVERIPDNSLVIPRMQKVKIIDIIKRLKCKYSVIGRETGEKLCEDIHWSHEKLVNKGDYFIIRRDR
jgi:UDP-N-acetylglucosamine 4,6-dehydratase